MVVRIFSFFSFSGSEVRQAAAMLNEKEELRILSSLYVWSVWTSENYFCGWAVPKEDDCCHKL